MRSKPMESKISPYYYGWSDFTTPLNFLCTFLTRNTCFIRELFIIDLNGFLVSYQLFGWVLRKSFTFISIINTYKWYTVYNRKSTQPKEVEKIHP